VGIRNFSPQFRNIADNKNDCGIAAKKSCGTAITDLQNLTSAILQLSTVSGQFPYFIVHFSSAQYALKINQKQFLQSSVSMETKKLKRQ
jgi:hypothetical protein